MQITKTDEIDLAALNQQGVIRALGITVGQFGKTVQGRSIIEAQKVFCLGGQLYQGYNQRALDVSEDQVADKEWDSIIDVDGSLAMVAAKRAGRLEGVRLAKNQELGGRRKIAIAAERDELELQLLRKRAETELAQPEVAPPVFECGACSKEFDSARALNMHKVGAKH